MNEGSKRMNGMKVCMNDAPYLAGHVPLVSPQKKKKTISKFLLDC